MKISQIQSSLYEGEKCLNNLDTSKAYGSDGISPILPSVRSLFNKSLATSRVQVKWKHTSAISIHKEESVEPVTNYMQTYLPPANITKSPGGKRV